MGTSKRGGLDGRKADLPGPGSFNVHFDWRKLHKNPGFGSSLRGDVATARSTAAVPGPGNYNP